MTERLNERTFVKGECACYYLVLQNSSFLYMPYITVHMYMEGQIICKSLKSMRLAMAPFRTREFKYEMPLFFRGRYDIGVKRIQIHDLFGIFHYTLYPYEKKNILVKPRILDILFKNVPVARISEGELTSGFKETGNDEIMDIREYAYGDSFRKIHWKLSSKLNKTLVKETRNELDNDVVVLLNLQKPEVMDEDALLKEDCLIEELISNINYLLKRNVPVKLCFYRYGPMVLRATTPIEFQSLYQMVSEVKFNQTDDFAQAIEYFTDTETNGNLVYLFSVNLDGELISKAFHIKNKGFDLELYYVNLVGAEDDQTQASNDLADVLLKNDIRAFKLEPSIIHIEGSQQEVVTETVKVGVRAYEAKI
ncbi:MAG: DUF58 domain-containing protein [Clostridia bacterium]|nr:DUF58 domain-containing protein [Clostridia bacterium]